MGTVLLKDVCAKLAPAMPHTKHPAKQILATLLLRRIAFTKVPLFRKDLSGINIQFKP
jgi:hypothetical protein